MTRTIAPMYTKNLAANHTQNQKPVLSLCDATRAASVTRAISSEIMDEPTLSDTLFLRWSP